MQQPSIHPIAKRSVVIENVDDGVAYWRRRHAATPTDDEPIEREKAIVGLLIFAGLFAYGLLDGLLF